MPEKFGMREHVAAASAGILLGLGTLALQTQEVEGNKNSEDEQALIYGLSAGDAVIYDAEQTDTPQHYENVDKVVTTSSTTTTTLPPPTTTTAPKPPPSPPPPPPSGTHQEWMAAAGISPDHYDEVDFIMSRESSWDPTNVSPKGCIGLGQNCPDDNGNYWLKEACPNWQSDPVCQLKRFEVYAVGRYDSWEGAVSAWKSQGWW